jgi:phosphoribosylaminoimidazole-succinocarboxamide synthase
MNATSTVAETRISGLSLVHRGKVRDVYEVDGETLLLVATDRISAFDCILPTLIQNKGAILTQLSAFWFDRLQTVAQHHLITADIDQMPEPLPTHPELRGRSAMVRRTKVFPVECVVRGYLEGSGWKDYRETGTICGHRLPAGLGQCDRLPEPLFTPATKASEGHDENIDEAAFASIVGEETAERLRDLSLAIYKAGSEHALSRGIIIADTKFEFGLDREGRILLIDEVLTPDSSRFWSAESYRPGRSQPSFDKQFVREYLETLDWDKRPPAPALPDDVAAATEARYLRAFELLTGSEFVV